MEKETVKEREGEQGRKKQLKREGEGKEERIN